MSEIITSWQWFAYGFLAGLVPAKMLVWVLFRQQAETIHWMKETKKQLLRIKKERELRVEVLDAWRACNDSMARAFGYDPEWCRQEAERRLAAEEAGVNVRGRGRA